MNTLAERYVQLVLALGVHDEDYVDAYYGPAEWRRAVETARRPLDWIHREADALRALVDRTAVPGGSDDLHALRRTYLGRQLEAVAGRARMLQGERFSFDEEARLLYDVTPPRYDEAGFERLRAKLGDRLPGAGELAERYARFRAAFVVPREKVDGVFRAAIGAARSRTLQRLPLPPVESFTVEYVTDRPWSGYNWYKGGYRSVIQVNLDLPVHVDRALDLACHEGYPGHHVYNVLLEATLVVQHRFMEFTVYALFSPQSLIAEGTANVGIDVAFPSSERLEFERDTIFPLAGLDAARAVEVAEVRELADGLSFAGNEAARRYLDGQLAAGDARDWLVRYALQTPEQAAQRVAFFDRYRSYVINYNLGRDLVRRHLERRGGHAKRPDRLWQEFGALLASPRLPSGLSEPR